MKSIIGILSWNGLAYTKACIESLSCIEFPYQLMVWDNGSTDGSREYLESIKSDNNTIFLSEKNVGMVLPWNFFLKHAFVDNSNDYCFLCNNDIRFTKQINKILPFMEENSEFGLICPAMMGREIDLTDLENEAQHYTEKHRGELDIGGLAGPCMIIPKHAFDLVGYYDEELPFSFEDMDMHQRMIKAGYGTVVHHECPIFHWGGVSTQFTPKEVSERCYRRFQEKHG